MQVSAVHDASSVAREIHLAWLGSREEEACDVKVIRAFLIFAGDSVSFILC